MWEYSKVNIKYIFNIYMKQDYSKDRIEKVKNEYYKLLGINANRKDDGNWGEEILVRGDLVQEIKELRDKYCKMEKGTDTCKKVEVGGKLELIDDGNRKSLVRIQKMLTGNGDTINLGENKNKEILFHTHPNAYGTWNKLSPPSEFDLFHSIRLGIEGKNQVNLVWDKHGVYIYYLYPSFVDELKDKLLDERAVKRLIEILRYTKMGWGFYYKNKDYPTQYSSFSSYRNLLKEMGFYVDYKKFSKNKSEGNLIGDIIFIKPK